MNILQLVIKQMRQRALSTWLTLLSVLLGVALAVAILILQREGANLFGQKDYGFDVLVGPKGSGNQLVLNTIYHIDQSQGNIPYSIYEELANPRQPFVRFAVPYAVGDTYENHRVIATLPKLFGASEDGTIVDPQKALPYRKDRRLTFGQGRSFHARKFEAVIGADVPKRTGLKLGERFRITHGMPTQKQSADVHEEHWEVVGVLAPTHTAVDRVIYIPLTSFYAIAGHEEGLKAHAEIRQRHEPGDDTPATAPVDEDHAEHEAHAEHEHAHEEDTYTLLADGTIELKVPKQQWELSAVLVQSRGTGAWTMRLMYDINNGPYAMAVNPAMVMREFFEVFLAPTANLLTAIAWLVIVVAAVGILVSIYNSVSARKREVAILRALGATRAKILALICLEAGLIGLVGGVLGLIAGHVLAAAGSIFLAQLLGEGINWLAVAWQEGIYLLAVVLIAVIAGLVPALKAYRTPVATNLAAT